MTSEVVDILRQIVGELKQMARSETVIGEPITVGDKTIVPVVRILVGFGAGGGEGKQEKLGSGFGGGGGGGARIEPAAFIILDAEGIHLLPAKTRSWERVVEAIPDFAQRFRRAKKKERGEPQAEGTEDTASGSS